MHTFEDRFAASLDAVLSSVCAISMNSDEINRLKDATILGAERKIGEITRVLDACAALVAGVVAHRSRPDLGHSGLAQREGFRNAESLVQRETGSTAREASTLVQVGRMMRDAVTSAEALASDGVSSREPWMREVGEAVGNRLLSIEAARAIAIGLGSPSLDAAGFGITVEILSTAARSLLHETATSGLACVNPEWLLRRAREIRDELDEAGIVDRERRIYERRSVRRITRANGLSQYIITPDIESAAFWDDVYDKMTSPRRGGPRFVSASEKSRATRIAGDERTLEQFAHDAFTQLLRIAVNSDDAEARQIIGSRQPGVRVLVTAQTLTARAGHGRIEGGRLPISVETVERIACETSTIELTFDVAASQPLDLGREQRLFSNRQRVALAARDGGCMAGDCESPPSWCEAHHINHWGRDHGGTDLADGILLCRFHHLLLHNNRWEIYRNPEGYWLVPPTTVDPDQVPRLMASKSAALRDLQREVG